jgi:hypothetical protein
MLVARPAASVRAALTRRAAAAVAAALVAHAAAPTSAHAQTPLDLALNKAASARCTYENNGPSRAVDGNIDGNLGDGSVFHGCGGAGDWWYVDLGANYSLSSIQYFNRTDCCSVRIIGATVGVFASTPYGSDNAAPVWSAAIDNGGPTDTFSPGGAVGRYIGIQEPAQVPPGNSQGDLNLQIAELEAFGMLAPAPSTTTPEPASVALLGAGLAGVAAVIRRRRPTA